jgi:hypothetical protein
MLLFDSIYKWDGWGGRLKLASGKCTLRLYDMTRGSDDKLALLKPFIALATDHPESAMTIKSCAGHIVTCIVKDFGIDPARMTYIEYYPVVIYGDKKQHMIRERFETLEFVWCERKALHPKWRNLSDEMLKQIKPLARGMDLLSV